MKADFNIEYSSGRTETLSATGATAIREMRADLERAQQLGGVRHFTQQNFETADQQQAARRKQAAVYLKPETVKALEAQAITNGTSVSQEIAKRVEAGS